jgi:CTP synthase (UTP-ammonia lyase)
MEHNRRKDARKGTSGYRIRDTAWILSGYRKPQQVYRRHEFHYPTNNSYSTSFQIIKVITSGILTVTMVLILMLVVHTLL